MLYTLYQRVAQSKMFKPSPKSSGKGSYQLGSYKTGESGKTSKKSKKFLHPLSMPNDKAMGSDERIVVNPKGLNDFGPTAGNGTGQPEPYARDIEEGNPRGNRGITVQTELSVHSTNEQEAPVGNGQGFNRFPQ